MMWLHGIKSNVLFISLQTGHVRTDGAVSRGQTSESKSHEFEYHGCHLVRAYGRQYVQVRPVRPKLSHLTKYNF